MGDLMIQYDRGLEIGDLVRVDFNNVQMTLYHRARLVYMPQSQGESWRFKCEDTGRISYVSEGCTVTKLEENE